MAGAGAAQSSVAGTGAAEAGGVRVKSGAAR